MRRHAVPLLIVFGAWLIYAGALFSPRSNLYLTDTFCQDIPLRLHCAEMIRSGTFPHWTPYVQCGFPIYSDGQTGVMYPFFLLYLIWPAPEAHDVFMALHYLLAGLFAYLFLTRRSVSLGAAAAGGVTYMAGSYLESTHVIPGYLATACWLPLSLYLFELHAEGRRSAKWWCAWVNAFALLAGHVHVALISYSLQALYLLWRRPDATWRRFLKTSSVVFVLPLALCAIQMVPTQHFLGVSNRSEGFLQTDLDLGQFLSYGINWKHLVTFVWPDYLGTPWDFPLPDPPWQYTPWEEGLALFHGYAAILLVPWAIVLCWRRRDVKFWFAMIVFGLLISSWNPVRMLFFFVPLHNLFRWPARYLLIVSFAISVLVAIGMDDLRGRIAARLTSQAKALTADYALAVLVVALVFHRTLAPYLTSADFYDIHDPRIVAAARGEDHFRLLPAARALYGYWEADEERLRANARFLPVSYNLLYEVPAATLFDQGNAVSPQEMTDLVRSRHPNFLRLAAVTHVSAPAVIPEVDKEELEILQPVPLPPMEDLELLGAGESALYRYRRAMPRAWMVYQSEVVADPEARLAAVLDDDFDPAETAIVERRVPQFVRPVAEPVVRFEQTRPNELTIDVTTETEGLLVVADTYAEDFTAQIDGEPTMLLRANHAFRGVVVPAGSHRVTMAFYPDSFYFGRLLTALAVFGTTWGLWRARRADKVARLAGADAGSDTSESARGSSAEKS